MSTSSTMMTWSSLSKAAVGLMVLAQITSGHLIMQQPQLPCKLRANAFEVSTENYLKVGESNTMTWEGSASHGGGTCQLSVTLDREPTANSKFKVIASWIGGCPTDSAGNGGTHPFNYTIPPEVPNGKATLAWNWVSKLSGQPENYMNCAPITVSGGASDTKEFDQLEDLFLVNLPSSDCGSQLSHDLEIPNPGKYVTTFASTDLATPTGPGCAAKGQAKATEGASSGASSAAASSPAATITSGPASLSFNYPTPDASSSDAAGAAGTTHVTATTMVTVTSGAAGNYSNPVSYVPTASSGDVASVPAAATSAAATSAGSSYSSGTDSGSSSGSSAVSGSNSTSSGSSSCSTDGAVVCSSDGTQWGLCNFGKVSFQPVAAGTTCSNGVVAKRAHVRRHVGHPHARFSY
ncbi:hypothetical protein H2203_001091 [Taxawa tesnikishii (nom. ined.)]|nr:hypothetical protein H2203_001091 [Dothideales sp. JES 119]